jgi:hypothetical protein
VSNDSNRLFADMTGVSLPVDEFDLGHGIIMRKTYAHLMSTFMMAFKPAEPGKTHPIPWSSVSGGDSYDIYVELEIPGNLLVSEWLAGKAVVWWITAMFRLKGVHQIASPVIADRKFSEIPQTWRTARAQLFEASIRRLAAVNGVDHVLEMEDLKWVSEFWEKAGRLMHRKRDFNDAFIAFDYSTSGVPYSMGLLALWGALEHLFAPAKQELRFRVSALIACFLEPAGESRIKLHRRLTKLYDARSEAAHTAGEVDSQALVDTHEIMSMVLKKMIMQDHVPTKEELDAALFGFSG